MSDITYTHFFTGSEIEAIPVKQLLEENHFNYIEKNHVQAGLRSGFFGGENIEIHIDKDKYEDAKKLIDSIK